MYPEFRILSVPLPTYPFLISAGLVAAILVRRFLPVRHVPPERLGFFLVPGAFGLVVGAKLPVLLSHGLQWEILFTGRSLVGALIGAWGAVVLAKWWLGERWTGGGDGVVLPLAAGLAVGRGACLLAGCCWGVDGLPVPAFEIAFHVSALAFFLTLRHLGGLTGLWFPTYLFSYCAFRFVAEFVRSEPRILGPITAYHVFAVVGMIAAASVIVLRLRRPVGMHADH